MKIPGERENATCDHGFDQNAVIIGKLNKYNQHKAWCLDPYQIIYPYR